MAAGLQADGGDAPVAVFPSALQVEIVEFLVPGAVGKGEGAGGEIVHAAGGGDGSGGGKRGGDHIVRIGICGGDQIGGIRVGGVDGGDDVGGGVVGGSAAESHCDGVSGDGHRGHGVGAGGGNFNGNAIAGGAGGVGGEFDGAGDGGGSKHRVGGVNHGDAGGVQQHVRVGGHAAGGGNVHAGGGAAQGDAVADAQSAGGIAYGVAIRVGAIRHEGQVEGQATAGGEVGGTELAGGLGKIDAAIVGQTACDVNGGVCFSGDLYGAIVDEIAMQLRNALRYFQGGASGDGGGAGAQIGNAVQAQCAFQDIGGGEGAVAGVIALQSPGACAGLVEIPEVKPVEAVVGGMVLKLGKIETAGFAFGGFELQNGVVGALELNAFAGSDAAAGTDDEGLPGRAAAAEDIDGSAVGGYFAGEGDGDGLVAGAESKYAVALAGHIMGRNVDATAGGDGDAGLTCRVNNSVGSDVDIAGAGNMDALLIGVDVAVGGDGNAAAGLIDANAATADPIAASADVTKSGDGRRAAAGDDIDAVDIGMDIAGGDGEGAGTLVDMDALSAGVDWPRGMDGDRAGTVLINVKANVAENTGEIAAGGGEGCGDRVGRVGVGGAHLIAGAVEAAGEVDGGGGGGKGGGDRVVRVGVGGAEIGDCILAAGQVSDSTVWNQGRAFGIGGGEGGGEFVYRVSSAGKIDFGLGGGFGAVGKRSGDKFGRE